VLAHGVNETSGVLPRGSAAARPIWNRIFFVGGSPFAAGSVAQGVAPHEPGSDTVSAMNTQLRFNHEKRSHSRLSRSDYRAYYDEVAAGTLRSIVRHWRMIAGFVVLAVVLACIITPLMPRKYTAEALVYPDLLSQEQGKGVPLASVDGAAIVAGEARLIRSDALLREVAKRLRLNPGAPQLRPGLTQSLDRFRAAWFPETRDRSPFDRMVAMLRNKVMITSDTRSYLISISFAASSAEEAAQVVNAVVTEYLRDKDKQRRLSKVRSLEAELRQQLAIYGEKHPKTLHIAAELDAGRASLEAAMSWQDGDQYEIANDQSVRLAVPNHTPSSPRGFVIFGFLLLSALLAGISVAVWRDRRKAAAEQVFGQPHRNNAKLKYPVG
jgi:uncharacterized protein involved in exopolysaccharide biosynthesis